MSIIKIENLVRDYGEGKGVFDISFHVNQGEAFGFLGPNGAGKTTTIRHLMGFLKPESGKCTIDGLDCWNEREKVQARLGYIPGEIHLLCINGSSPLVGSSRIRISGSCINAATIPSFCLVPLLIFFILLLGSNSKRSNNSFLRLCVPILRYSAMNFKNSVPDISSKKLISPGIYNKTVLMSSHIFEEVERTCDRIGIIRKGRMITVDSAVTLHKRHTHSYTVTLENEAIAKAFASDFDGICNGTKVTVTTKQSLEEIFMNYYGGDKND